MASSTLYAPKVPAVQPAFEYTYIKDAEGKIISASGTATISFTLSEASADFTHILYTLVDPNLSAINGLNSVLNLEAAPAGYRCIAKDNNKPLSFDVKFSEMITLKDKDNEDKTVKWYSLLTQNQFYQMQIYLYAAAEEETVPVIIESDWLMDHAHQISLPSTVTLLRPIPEPILTINGVKADSSITTSLLTVLSGDIGSNFLEPLDQYRIQIGTKSDEDMFFDSGYIHNTLGTRFEYKFENLFLDPANYYQLTFQYKTLNGYTKTDNKYTLKITKAESEEESVGSFEYFPEMGMVEITSDEITYRSSSKYNYLDYQPIAKRDFTIENGVRYKYYAKDKNDQYCLLKNEKKVVAYTDPIELEHIFLSDQNAQLAIMFNPNISSFKWVTQEGLTNTLGGKYPIFRRNGDTYYRQFNLSGILAFDNDVMIQSPFTDSRQDGGPDPEECSLDSPYGILSLSAAEKAIIMSKYQSMFSSLKDTPDKWEVLLDQAYHDYTLKFLTNGKKKLFRSGPEGNMIVVLTNVSFTPNKSLGRRAYDFSATVTECNEYSYSSLEKEHLSNNIYHNTTEFNWMSTAFEYFSFNLLADNTYEIKARDINNIPPKVILPYAYNGRLVTKIADQAFSNCTRLTNIIIPNNIVKIGQGSFQGCGNLASVTIPDNVMSIGSGAFYNTAYYKNNSNWENNVLYIDKHLIQAKLGLSGEYQIRPGTLTIAGGAFSGCNSLTNIIIPNSITNISYYAFQSCSKLKSVTIPDSVTDISDYAFYLCSGLTNITIPNNVKNIGNYAFYYCSGLTSIIIGEDVTNISRSAFSYCTGLTSITCSTTAIQYIPKDNLQTIVITSGESIENSTFRSCGNLTSITLPFVGASRDATGHQAVFGYIFGYTEQPNSNLIEGATYQYKDGDTYYHYYIPTSLRSVAITGGNIGDNAFYNCQGLTSITIPDSARVIGDYAFYNCEGLTKMIIPNNVNNIGNYAFQSCGSLTSITIPNSISYISVSMFESCSKLTSVVIPNGITHIGAKAFRNCTGLTRISIPSSVMYIRDSAFEYCNKLTNIVISNGVSDIGSSAFRGCAGLTSITIPDGVRIIGNYAFEDCAGLTKIVIGRNIFRMSSAIFRDCRKLISITCKAFTPPNINSTTFTDLPTGCIIYVPASSVDTYKRASFWSAYAERIQAISGS